MVSGLETAQQNTASTNYGIMAQQNTSRDNDDADASHQGDTSKGMQRDAQAEDQDTGAMGQKSPIHPGITTEDTGRQQEQTYGAIFQKIRKRNNRASDLQTSRHAGGNGAE